MSEDLLRDESITTFFAGHETTARTMTFAWYALAANPKVTERLHGELDGVLGGRPLTMEALRRLPPAPRVTSRCAGLRWRRRLDSFHHGRGRGGSWFTPPETTSHAVTLSRALTAQPD